jgi:hypothetical protein
MPDQRKTLTLLGQNINVIEKPIVGAKECFNEYTLEDGTVLRVKNVATAISQIEGQTMPDGSPVFLIFSTPVTTVVSSPEHRLPKE